MATKKEVPRGLRIWFLIHAIVDVLFAIPLMLFPKLFLEFLGLNVGETMTPRLVGAALIGIGGASFFTYKKKLETYNTLLTLKIIWSLSAIVALVLSIFEQSLIAIYFIIMIFGIFSSVWIYYKKKIN
jgi:hypothetical protein